MGLTSRRRFLAETTAMAAALPLTHLMRRPQLPVSSVFRHGVASGDPLADRVILWTRVSTSRPQVNVAWAVATDAAMNRVVALGEGPATVTRDYTVKIDVAGLAPATTYYYRFEAEGTQSPIGRTRTLAIGHTPRVRLGVVSCSNYPFGYFNAYAALARRADLDAVVHLGDYIYEYANGTYGDGRVFGRIPMPNKEMVALVDSRQRHAQYKGDPDLQEIHRQHPFIVIWDDHELTNNAWRGGAENHDPDEGEGDWMVRRAAAVRAFFEWMPIREDARALSPRIYRTLRFGDLADLVLLDTRLAGRDQQTASRDDIRSIESAARSLMGRAQEGWLHDELAESKRSGTSWQLLGQQVMFAPMAQRGKATTNPDSWDGYRASRERVFEMLTDMKLVNVAILTGDVHSNWAFDVPRDPFGAYNRSTGRGSLAVEFAVTSVTSPSNLGVGPEGEARLAALYAAQPHLHYADGRHRGYYIIDITPDRVQADYFGMATIASRTPDETFLKGFATPSGTMHLTEQSSPVAPRGHAADPAPET